MTQRSTKAMAMDGYKPIEQRGWVPQKVQGGYVPQARAGVAQVPLSPPKGGSAIKSPANPSR